MGTTIQRPSAPAVTACYDRILTYLICLSSASTKRPKTTATLPHHMAR